MSEPINNPTPAPAPEPAPEKTFTQAEVDSMIGKRLAKAMKGMPSEEELTAYRTWKDGQAGEKERWDKLTGERDTLSGKLTTAEAERDQLKRELYVLKKGLTGEEAEFIAFRQGRWWTTRPPLSRPWTRSPPTARRLPLTGLLQWAEGSKKQEKTM